MTGFRRKQENEVHERYEQMRNIMYACLAPHQKKGTRFTPQSLLKFPWEKEASVGVIDLEALEQHVLENNTAFWARWDARKDGQADC